MRTGAGGSLQRARGHRAVVADSARPESRALDAAFTASVERAIRPRRPGPNAPLMRRRPGSISGRTARACSGGCCAARMSPPPATESESRKRWIGRRARAGHGRRLLRARHAGVLRRRRARGRAGSALPAAAAGRRPQGRAARDAAGPQPGRCQGEADYQLHIIYLWYERQTRRAIELLYAPQARYPGNPLYLAQIAQIQDVYEHDIVASLETWRQLLAAAREQARQQRRARGSTGPPRRRAHARPTLPDRRCAGAVARR